MGAEMKFAAIALSVLFLCALASAAEVAVEQAAAGRIVGENPAEMISQLEAGELNLRHATYSYANSRNGGDIAKVGKKGRMVAGMFDSSDIWGAPLWDRFVFEGSMGNWQKNEFAVLETEGGLRNNEVYLNSTGIETPVSTLQWADKFAETKPLLVFDSHFAGLYLPDEVDAENSLVGKFAKDSVMIAPTAIPNTEFVYAFLCNLPYSDSKTIGEAYRDARNDYYSNAEIPSGLSLMSYTLYGSPATKYTLPQNLPADFINNRQEICGKYGQEILNDSAKMAMMSRSMFRASEDTLQAEGETMARKVEFAIDRHEITGGEEFSLLEINQGMQSKEVGKVVLPRMVIESDFPLKTVITDVKNVSFSNPMEFTIANLPAWDGNQFIARDCSQENESAGVTYNHVFGQGTEALFVNVKPAEIADCNAGIVRLYQNFSYEIEYMPYSPVFLEITAVPEEAIPAESLNLKVKATGISGSGASGMLRLLDGESMVKEEPLAVTGEQEITLNFLAPGEEGTHNFSLQFAQGGEIMTETFFPLKVALVSGGVFVSDVANGSAQAGITLKNNSAQALNALVEFHLMHGQEEIEGSSSEFALNPGENSFAVTYNGLEREKTSYSVIINAVYDNRSAVYSAEIVTNHAPVLDSIADVFSTAGRLVEVEASASDADGDSLTITFSEPFGNDGKWQSTENDTGTYEVTVTASDGLLESKKTFRVFMDEATPNHAPVFDENFMPEKFAVGRQALFKVNCSDADGDALSYYADTNLFNVDRNTGNVAWTPSQKHIGVHSVVFSCSDGYAVSKKKVSFRVGGNSPPVIDWVIPDENYVVTWRGRSVRFEVSAHDPDGDEITYYWHLDVNFSPAASSFSGEADAAFPADIGWAASLPEPESSVESGIAGGAMPVAGSLPEPEKENAAENPEGAYAPVLQEVAEGNGLQENSLDAAIQLGEGGELVAEGSEPDEDSPVPLGKNDQNYYSLSTKSLPFRQYILTVDVNDGQFTASRNWDVRIDNNAPVLDSFIPEDNNVVVKRGTVMRFGVSAHDPNGDSLSYRWVLKNTATAEDENMPSDTNLLDFSADGYVRGAYVMKAIVSDGHLSASHSWNVEMPNTPPVIDSFLPAKSRFAVERGENVAFSVSAHDPDGDELAYAWAVDGNTYSGTYPDTNSFLMDTNQFGKGMHSVEAGVSDSNLSVYQRWDINITQQNSPPAIDSFSPEDGNLVVGQGETIRFSVSATDPDGDALGYVWSLKDRATGKAISVASMGNFLDFNSSNISTGEYDLNATVSDGIASVSHLWSMKIAHAPPVIDSYFPEKESIRARKGEALLFGISAHDPDGGRLSYEWAVDGKIPAYEQQNSSDGTDIAEKPKDSYFMLQTENLSLGQHTVQVSVRNAGNSVSHGWDVNVTGPNSPPVIDSFSPEDGNLVIEQGESIRFSVSATDPDDDPLKYVWSLTDTITHQTVMAVLDENFIDFNSYNINPAEYQLDVNAADGMGSASHSWNLKILENPPPVVDSRLPAEGTISVKKGNLVEFGVSAHDPLGGKVFYRWHVDGEEAKNNAGTADSNYFVLETENLSLGAHSVRASVNDYRNSVYLWWQVNVVSQNRAPAISNFLPADANLSAQKGEKIMFIVSAYDPDHDALTYEWNVERKGTIIDYFGGLLNAAVGAFISVFGGPMLPGRDAGAIMDPTSGWGSKPYIEFDTNKHRAGEYTITATVSDGNLSDSVSWKLTITPTAAKSAPEKIGGTWPEPLPVTGRVVEVEPERVQQVEPARVQVVEPQRAQNVVPQRVEPQKVQSPEQTKVQKVEPTRVQNIEPQRVEPQQVQRVEPRTVQNVVPQRIQNTQPQRVQNVEPSRVQQVEPQQVQNTQPQQVQPTVVQNVQQVEPQSVQPAQQLVQAVQQLPPVQADVNAQPLPVQRVN